MYKKSIEDPAGFWSEIASQFYWKEKWSPEVYTENLDVTKGPIKIEVSFNFIVLCVGNKQEEERRFWLFLLLFIVVQRSKHKHMLQCFGPKYWRRKWWQDRIVLGRKWTWLWREVDLPWALRDGLPGTYNFFSVLNYHLISFCAISLQNSVAMFNGLYLFCRSLPITWRV